MGGPEDSLKSSADLFVWVPFWWFSVSQGEPRAFFQLPPTGIRGTSKLEESVDEPFSQSGSAAARTRGSYFGAQYLPIAKRRGPNKAAVAVAHSLIDLIWHLLTTAQCYQDLGNDYFLRRRDPERETARLVRQLQQLGYQVTLTAMSTPAA